jgi:subtilisin-like proprotein convertase family protein
MGTMSRRVLALAASGFVVAAVGAVPAHAATGTFSNATPITIPAGAPGVSEGPADPYPSNINVTGLTGTITDVNATLNGFSHTFPHDVEVLLAGPGGQAVVLMRRADEGTDVTNLTLTFDDEAAGPVPSTGTLTSGSYKPSGPRALSVFDGTSASGQYSLFVDDDVGGDTGSISGGWSIAITTLETTITKRPKGKTTKKTATFEFTADQAGATFECAVDGKPFAPCTSPRKVKVGRGRHEFEVRATVGGVTDDTPATATWKVVKKKK